MKKILEKAVDGSDLIVILTDHNEFKELDNETFVYHEHEEYL